MVGPTGAGKTTLINLLERFYDVSGGSIRYDGVDTRDLSRDELRAQFSMVLQDTWLFTGSIYDNIKYGNDDATDEQIIEAAKAAHVDDFVRKLPEGYNTVLNEDASNISQGQRQLITIARAFLANPDVLILDETGGSCIQSILERTAFPELSVRRGMRNRGHNSGVTPVNRKAGMRGSTREPPGGNAWYL
ncbi:ATP-binding cassette domain-containing protein [Klebsiella pneumoniae]|uniref:ATP-binding cassette domain-containing protein n=1 Tax=Klebsiella pneumoniae TaxID=573 RepID=UPI003A4C70B3